MQTLCERLVAEINELLASKAGTSLLEREMPALISSIFGIEGVRLADVYSAERSDNAIYRYVLNTGKPVVDNQLSSYSAFPELVAYMEAGYRSACVAQFGIGRKPVFIAELLSRSENRFSNEMLAALAPGMDLLASAIAYRKERARSEALARYFGAAFDGGAPQMLVGTDNLIVRTNPAAKAMLGAKRGDDLMRLLGVGYEKLEAHSAAGTKLTLEPSQGRGAATYAVEAARISDSLLYLRLTDLTKTSLLDAVLEAMTASHTGLLLLNCDLVITYATAGLSSLLKYDVAMVVGESIEKILTADSWAEVRAHAAKTAQASQPQLYGYAYISAADGSTPCVRYAIARTANAYALALARADEHSYIANLSDATLGFISGTSDSVIAVDRFGFITDCNMSAQGSLGFGRDALIGKDVRSLYVGNHTIERDLSYAINGKGVKGTYVELVKADGTHMPATHAIYAMRSTDGEPSYLIAIKELETKRRMQEYESAIKELRREVNALKNAGELKSQFLYNISHELKTPLTSIKGFARLLYDGDFGALGAQQNEIVQILIDEADRLAFMIQQVLDAVRLESNKVRLELREVDLGEVLASPGMKGLEEAARAKGLEFKSAVEFGVPHVAADPNKLLQVLINLAGNAIKFTEKGSVSIRIYRKSKRTVKCEVSDTGIGIREEDKRKIFKEFYQAPRLAMLKQEGSGTGLGLSITKYLVRLHHGRLSVDSVYGKGSTFSFTLPIMQPSNRRQRQQPAQQQEP